VDEGLKRQCLELCKFCPRLLTNSKIGLETSKKAEGGGKGRGSFQSCQKTKEYPGKEAHACNSSARRQTQQGPEFQSSLSNSETVF
jgi:hypothetical protein